MKIRITGGKTIPLRHDHFKIQPGENSDLILDSLPTEGALMHRGQVVMKPGTTVSTAEIVMGNLLYVSVPDQEVSTLFDYTIKSRSGNECSGYIIFEPDTLSGSNAA